MANQKAEMDHSYFDVLEKFAVLTAGSHYKNHNPL